MPAYTFPENRTDLAAVRVVVRRGFTHDLTDMLVHDLERQLGGDQQLLLGEAVVAITATPGQHDVEAIAGVQFVDAAQRLQRPVATKVQIEIAPTPCLHGQAARSCVRRGAAPGVELDPEPNRSIEDTRRANQLLVPGRRIVTQIGAGAQRQRVRQRQQAGRAPKLGDRDGRIGLITLTSLDHLVGRDRKTAASGLVE